MKLIKIIIVAITIGLLAGCGNKTKETENAPNQSTESTRKAPGKTHGETNDKRLPVIMDFSATWCGPCKMIAPYVHELAASNKDVVSFNFIDIDENPSLAEEYNIEAVPTFILIDANGQEVNRITGADRMGLDNLVSTARSLKH